MTARSGLVAKADPGRDWRYPGARWWKFDLHCHTPASSDYGKGGQQADLRKTSPEEWLLGFMRAGVDCVAVTDHHSGEWIDRLKSTLREMETEARPGFRPLYLFPGVEIAASTGTHVLAILDLDRTSEDVATLLGNVGYRGSRGECEQVAEADPGGVAEAIVKAGGIPILAHVDKHSGAWELPGKALRPLLDTTGIFAMEVIDPEAVKPDLYLQRRLAWAEVLGSDSHHMNGDGGTRFPGSHYSWIKMAAPCLEGLRLALLDGGVFSVRRSDELQPFDPWALPEHFVEAIEIENARYMGRDCPATLSFSPWLNALVGGRGTGKSTVLHHLRLVAGREGELSTLDEASEPRRTFERFNRVPAHRMDGGGLKEETRIRWTVTRDGVRYRIHWSAGGRDVTVEERQDGGWKPSPAHGTPDRFPLRLFSQGQIAALSGGNQQALMRLIDEAAGVDSLRDELNAARSGVFALRARIRELESKLGQRDAVAVRQRDVERKLRSFEEVGHASVLTTYRRRRRQRAEVERRLDVTMTVSDSVEETAAELQVEDLPDDLFDATAEEENEIIKRLESLAVAVRDTAASLRDSARELREVVSARRAELEGSAWSVAVAKANEAYEDLVKALQAEGVADPSAYGRLAQERQLLEGEMKRLASIREERDRLIARMSRQLTKVATARREAGRCRDEFLERTLGRNDFVRIRNLAYGSDPRVVERSLREVLGVLDDRFAGDILEVEGDGAPTGGIVAALLDKLPDDFGQRAVEVERRLDKLKDRLERACAGNGDFGGHFNNHLEREAGRRPELLDELLTWFPEDGLNVEYSRAGDGQDFLPISQASAGQRSAAMLAFLLAHGVEPLVLDQPEDDLDNHLIYDVIVRQIREEKVRRQIIVVTHNPNIVVNGDAEMLHALDFCHGQCVVVQKGSLQEAEMRDEICRVMEGGREAFGRRYRRLGREPADA